MITHEMSDVWWEEGFKFIKLHWPSIKITKYEWWLIFRFCGSSNFECKTLFLTWFHTLVRGERPRDDVFIQMWYCLTRINCCLQSINYFLAVTLITPTDILFHFLSYFLFLFFTYSSCSGPGSSVGIATDYGLDGPGSNPGGYEIFLPSTPALGPTQPPVQWVPGLSRG